MQKLNGIFIVINCLFIECLKILTLLVFKNQENGIIGVAIIKGNVFSL